MRPVPHTIRKNETYHFKRRVPSDVQSHPIFGGREFVQFSLKTKDRGTAALKAAEASKQFDITVLEARAKSRTTVAKAHADTSEAHRISTIPPQLVETIGYQTASELTSQFPPYDDYDLAAEDDKADGIRQTMHGFAGGMTIETWKLVLSELENPQNDDIKRRARRKLKEFGIKLDENAQDFKKVCFTIAQAEREAILHLLQQPIANPKYVSANSSMEATSGSLYRVADAAELYRTVNPSKAAMLKKLSVALRAWKELCGKDHFSLISKRDVYEFIDALKKTPTKATERFRGKTLREAIQINNDLATPYPTLSMKTIKAGYLAPLQTIASLAHEREFISSNPFIGLRIEGGSSPSARKRAFTIPELNHIFDHPIYTGCSSGYRRNSAGKMIIRDHYYWPVPIALFTGLRAEEIGNLEVSDFKLDQSKAPPHVHVRGTKTRAADRRVPIHPALFDIGLIEYVDQQRKAGHSLLFPQWKVSAGKSKSSGRPIRNFNENVVDPAMFDPPTPTFHCFRQTLRTELERSGFQSGMRKVIMGHKLGGMDEHYLKLTIGDTYEPFCNAVRYEGLELKKLTLG